MFIKLLSLSFIKQPDANHCILSHQVFEGSLPKALKGKLFCLSIINNLTSVGYYTYVSTKLKVAKECLDFTECKITRKENFT